MGMVPLLNNFFPTLKCFCPIQNFEKQWKDQYTQLVIVLKTMVNCLPLQKFHPSRNTGVSLAMAAQHSQVTHKVKPKYAEPSCSSLIGNSKASLHHYIFIISHV